MNEQFPGESEAISKFFVMLKETKKSAFALIALKMMPHWLAKIIIYTGLHKLFWNAWSGKYGSQTLEEILKDITDNEELRMVMGYVWGTYAKVVSKYLKHV